MSEHAQMDTLAYSSRMLSWAPLGKLLFVVAILFVNIATRSFLVPAVTLVIGLAMMAYSTNFKIPFFIALALAEAILILIIGCGFVSISGEGGEVLWDTQLLWIHVHMTTESFNNACLILFRSIAGITVMMGFATSTPIPHLSQALRQIRMPDEIAEIVVLIYRYAFLLIERMEAMWNAASCRMGFTGFKRTMSTTASIAVGTFLSSTEMADKAQMALECRNYRGYFPVFNMPPKAGVKWIVVTVASAAALYYFGMLTEGLVDMVPLFFGA